jgi:hypothetical protein
MAVTLYRQVGKGKSRRYQKVNLGRGRRPADLTGPYFLRFSLGDHCRLRAVAEHLPVCIDPVHRWVVLRDVFFAHHFPGATSRPAGRVVSIYLVAFLGGSPLGGLASRWLITRVGSAPVMLVVNGAALTLVALYFLIHGQDLKDI